MNIQTYNLLVGLVFGLAIGSFLNVVIYRLPKMMEAQWAREVADLQGVEIGDGPTFNLMVPRSACPNCGHNLHAWENVPVLGYIFLRGKCSSCKTRISARYPLVEMAMGVAAGWCTWRYGLTPVALCWGAFSAALITMALIDWDTTLLPDDITLPLLWAGLIASVLHWNPVGINDSIWGAVGGYMSLWIVYWVFKLITGKEGMGYGDFKLFSALGAWFGWQGLVPVILMSSIVGLVCALVMKFTSTLRSGGQMPFGPFLAGAGMIGMYLGPFGLRSLTIG